MAEAIDGFDKADQAQRVPANMLLEGELLYAVTTARAEALVSSASPTGASSPATTAT